MWAAQKASEFKVLQSGSWVRGGCGVGGGLDQTQRGLLCFGDWLCQKGFSLGRQRGTGWRAREFSEGLGEMWITASERKEFAEVYWGLSLWRHRGPFSGSAALTPQRGDFFIYLFNFMPCRPQNGPRPLSRAALSPFVARYPNPLQKEGPLMDALFIACCCFLWDEEEGGGGGWRMVAVAVVTWELA